ncbi:hypothetical protein Airi01_036510 [Actinoallomurus iriomotensis]|uniref:Uncharacterized protein n=1 Tax=Actinoallomurus iriomotensis TaxID=478107 RepID=A0A9W6VQ06_9ACTN|nr:hypothetical protein Airi01_036510 [Actinoallomurus iriomotensis]
MPGNHTATTPVGREPTLTSPWLGTLLEPWDPTQTCPVPDARADADGAADGGVPRTGAPLPPKGEHAARATADAAATARCHRCIPAPSRLRSPALPRDLTPPADRPSRARRRPEVDDG